MSEYYEPKVGVPCRCVELAAWEQGYGDNTRAAVLGGVAIPLEVVPRPDHGRGMYSVYRGELLTMGRWEALSPEEEAAVRLGGSAALR